MKQAIAFVFLATLLCQAQGFREPDPLDFADHKGYTQLFDGVSLKDWVGNPEIWRVENGAIVGESTLEKPSGNSYISYHGLIAKDFDLKFEIKVEYGGGSGIQYRSQTGIPWRRARPGQTFNLDWMMTGPQADYWFPVNPRSFVYTGQLMAVYIDDDPDSSNNKPGMVGIEIEGARCKVSVRNIRLKKIS